MNYAKRTNLYLFAVGVLTFVGTAIQTILLCRYYDAGRTLYAQGTQSYPVAVAVILIVLLSASVFFTLPGGRLRNPRKTTFENHDSASSNALARSAEPGMIPVKIGALILLFGALLSGFLLFYGSFPVDHAKDLWQAAANGSAESSIKMAGTLLRFSAYVGILAAVYPAVLLIAGKHDSLSAVATTIWLLLLLLSVYFDNSAVLNDPCRSLEILGLSAAVLWMLTEINRTLGKAKRRTYTFLSLAAFGILMISALPRLIATGTGALNFNSRTMIPVAMLGIAVMIAGRLYQFRSAIAEPAPEEEDEPEAEAESETKAEPVIESVPVPVHESETESAFTPESEGESPSEGNPEFEGEIVPEPESFEESGPASDVEAEPYPESTTEPEPDVEFESEPAHPTEPVEPGRPVDPADPIDPLDAIEAVLAAALAEAEAPIAPAESAEAPSEGGEAAE